MTRGDAQRRRRDVLATLAAAAVLTFLLAVATGGVSVWLLHLSVDAAVLGYVAMLMQLQQRRYAPAARRARSARPQYAYGQTAYGAMPAFAAPQAQQIDLTQYQSYFVGDDVDVYGHDGRYAAEEDSYDNVYELPVGGRLVHPSLLRRAN